jgi:hypothetical protein
MNNLNAKEMRLSNAFSKLLFDLNFSGIEGSK